VQRRQWLTTFFSLRRFWPFHCFIWRPAVRWLIVIDQHAVGGASQPFFFVSGHCTFEEAWNDGSQPSSGQTSLSQMPLMSLQTPNAVSQPPAPGRSVGQAGRTGASQGLRVGRLLGFAGFAGFAGNACNDGTGTCDARVSATLLS
jgi:hypothetical protein